MDVHNLSWLCHFIFLYSIQRNLSVGCASSCGDTSTQLIASTSLLLFSLLHIYVILTSFLWHHLLRSTHCSLYSLNVHYYFHYVYISFHIILYFAIILILFYLRLSFFILHTASTSGWDIFLITAFLHCSYFVLNASITSLQKLKTILRTRIFHVLSFHTSHT